MFAKFDAYKGAVEAGNVEFLVADIMSLSLEDLVPGKLPVVVYLGHEDGKEVAAEVGVYYFDRNRFGRMVQASLNKPHLHLEIVPEFLNLLSVEFEH